MGVIGRCCCCGGCVVRFNLTCKIGGTHAWFNAPSGTAGNAITFTQAMTLNASGNLGVGTTDPQATIVAAGSNATVYKAMILRNGNGTDGSSVPIDFETSAGTQGSEAAMAGRIAGLRTGSGTSGALTFSTTNSGTLSERARITSGGDLQIANGNLVMSTSGKGIDFSATAGTGTSELFADYEEGTFTATAVPSTSGTITLDSGIDLLAYTKIGRVVFVQGLLEVSSVSSPVGTVVYVQNLPFTIADLT